MNDKEIDDLRKTCKHEDVLYHFSRHDATRFEKIFECQICGLTESRGLIHQSEVSQTITIYPSKKDV